MTFIVQNFTWNKFQEIVNLVSSTNGSPHQDLARNPDSFRSWLEQPDMSVEKNLLFVSTESQPIGYVIVSFEPPLGRAIISGSVHQDYRRQGIGRQLLLQAKCLSQESGMSHAQIAASPNQPGTLRFLDKTGFSRVRIEWHMRRERTTSPPLDLPPEYSLRSMKTGEEPILTTLQNVAFESNWGFSPNTIEQVAYRVALPGSSPKNVLLLFHDKDPIGYCWTMTNSTAHGEAGVIMMTGILPDYRGKGLGRVVVIAGIHHLTDKGMSMVDLTVDSENTPARELYLSLGFHQQTETHWYEHCL